MKLALPRPTLGDAADIAGRAWRWWRGEIAALVPQTLRTRLAPARPVVAIDRETDGFAVRLMRAGGVAERGMVPLEASKRAERPSVLTAALGMPGVAGDRVLLRLPDNLVLRRRIALPLAPARDLRGLIGFELERQTPFIAGQVRYDFRVIERDQAARRLTIELALVKNRHVEELLDLARLWHLRPAAITTANGAWSPDFLQASVSAGMTLRRHRTSLVLAGAVTASLTALWWVEADRQTDYEAALAAALAQSRGGADATKALRQDAEALDAHLALLPRLRAAPDAARILEELAQRLPDNTYLSDFEINGRSIRIHGTSTAATGLIAILGESPLLTNIRFAAPVVQASSAGAERFDLALEIRDGDGP